MTKVSAKPNAFSEKYVIATLPWTSSLFGDHAEIDGFNSITGKWETIANVRSVAGVDAEDIAAFIIQAVNEYKRLRNTDTQPRHAIGGLQ